MYSKVSVSGDPYLNIGIKIMCLSLLLVHVSECLPIQGISALHWACSSGNMEAVQVLMSAGAYPNHMEVDNERLTPLDYAIIGGHQEIAQYLIEQHALTISGIKELAASLIQVTTDKLPLSISAYV